MAFLHFFAKCYSMLIEIKESRIAKIEKKAMRNGYLSYFMDPTSGSFYKGFWKNDKKNGYGYQIFDSEKYCYEGDFRDDKFHGFGKLGRIMKHTGDIEILYEGYWENGKMKGPGKLVKQKNLKVMECENSKPSFSENLEINEDSLERISIDSIDLICPPRRVEVETEPNDETSPGPLVQSLNNAEDNAHQDKSSSPNLRNPAIHVTNNCISFQQLKQVYNEFQNRAREEEKNDVWNEIVNRAYFRTRPDPNQIDIHYVEPNAIDERIECPKGIFFENKDGKKISVKSNEIIRNILNKSKTMKPIYNLNMKEIDETKLTLVLYDGMMENNEPNGFGTGHFTEDIVYCGNWRNGMFHGKGILLLPNQCSFEGNFENGRRCGYGVLKNFLNGYIQKGFFVNGSFVKSSIEIFYKRQSAPYPIIYPLPKLNICSDESQDDQTQTEKLLF